MKSKTNLLIDDRKSEVERLSLYALFEGVLQSLGMQCVTHPLFYNAKFALRFDIGNNGNDVYLRRKMNPRYAEACLSRAKQIYGALKSQPDLLVIDGSLWEWETAEEFVSAVLSATKLPLPHEINTGKGNFLLWKLQDFQPDGLLSAIIAADLGSGNYFLTSSVYFVCTKDNVLFHLYDDRGADLAAAKKETIRHIYNELNDLILDYDQNQIDAIFKN